MIVRMNVVSCVFAAVLVLFCALVWGWVFFRVYRNLNFNDFSLTMDLSSMQSYRISLHIMFDKHNTKNWAITIDL
jgi:hypothetical protein